MGDGEHLHKKQTSSRHVSDMAVVGQTSDSVAASIETALMLLKIPECFPWAVSCTGPERDPPHHQESSWLRCDCSSPAVGG